MALDFLELQEYLFGKSFFLWNDPKSDRNNITRRNLIFNKTHIYIEALMPSPRKNLILDYKSIDFFKEAADQNMPEVATMTLILFK